VFQRHGWPAWETNNQIKFSTHSFHVTAQSGKQQVTAFFQPTDRFLSNIQGYGQLALRQFRRLTKSLSVASSCARSAICACRSGGKPESISSRFFAIFLLLLHLC
jgi:hypothetical protein